MNHDDLELLQPIAARLEADLVRLFTMTRDQIVAHDRDPRPPAPAPAAPPPRPTAANNWGFHAPAPKHAPRLPAETIPPEVAQQKLLRYVEQLRAAAVCLHNASRLLAGIADLLEHGTKRAINRGRYG